MEKLLEKEIERRMARSVKARGGLSYKFVSPNAPGVPDRIVVAPGGAVWFVELKTEAGRVSALQRSHLTKLENRGANVRVLFGARAVEDFISEVFGNG